MKSHVQDAAIIGSNFNFQNSHGNVVKHLRLGKKMCKNVCEAIQFQHLYIQNLLRILSVTPTCLLNDISITITSFDSYIYRDIYAQLHWSEDVSNCKTSFSFTG